MSTRIVVVGVICAALAGCPAEVRMFGSGGSGGGTSSSHASSASSASSTTASATASSSSGMAVVCGDGLVDSTEGCDDGNAVDGDGCSSACVAEKGYACAGAPSACAPICGDGLLVGKERCDDGNAADGDGCTTKCDVEPYFRCVGAPSVCAPIKILAAPSTGDTATYRAAISAITGGPVDYLDAETITPTLADLQAYDCVYTWVINGYMDHAAFGDVLADFVDAGGNVVLGAFATYTMGFSLGGRIMTDTYSPVSSPTGNNHLSSAPYAGDGVTFLHAQVTAYACQYRDFLALQGAGVVDGTYTDAEIAHAYRPDFKVIYSNGVGDADGSGCTGDWPRLVANACAAGFLQ
jgi:cysteine-rich repeat protein